VAKDTSKAKGTFSYLLRRKSLNEHHLVGDRTLLQQQRQQQCVRATGDKAGAAHGRGGIISAGTAAQLGRYRTHCSYIRQQSKERFADLLLASF